MQIIVLGPHRSGTSLVTRLINMMGAYCFGEGASIGFNEENPKGFWERRDVIEANDAVLGSLEATWDSPLGWNAEAVPGEALDEFRQRFKNIFLDLDAHRPWVMKDPRLCLTLPLVKPLLEVPVVVYVSRSPLESAASLRTRNDLPLHYGLALWEYYAVSALKAGLDLPRAYVSYEALLAHPQETVKTLCRQLQECGVSGLISPTAREVDAFVDVRLWRERSTDSMRESCLTQQQLLLLEMFQGKREVEGVLEPSPITLSILEGVSMQDFRKVESESRRLEGYLKDMEKERDSLKQKLEEGEREFERVRQLLEQEGAGARERRAVLETLIAMLGEPGLEGLSENDQLHRIGSCIGLYQRRQELMTQDLLQLENYIHDLERILTAIQGSVTWRQASRAAAFIGRLTHRPPSRIMDDAAQIFAAFDHWRKARN